MFHLGVLRHRLRAWLLSVLAVVAAVVSLNAMQGAAQAAAPVQIRSGVGICGDGWNDSYPAIGSARLTLRGTTVSATVTLRGADENGTYFVALDQWYLGSCNEAASGYLYTDSRGSGRKTLTYDAGGYTSVPYSVYMEDGQSGSSNLVCLARICAF
jgi:hypothetical protein